MSIWDAFCIALSGRSSLIADNDKKERRLKRQSEGDCGAIVLADTSGTCISSKSDSEHRQHSCDADVIDSGSDGGCDSGD